jgi:hypothetical protein
MLSLVVVMGCTEHGKGGGGVFDGGTGGDSLPGKTCGGFSGEQCPSDQFCDFGRNSCGATDETGICVMRPLGCPDLFDPVCGCDGQIHGNSCDANAAGVDLDAFGSCPLEPGAFRCGFRQCQIFSEYCQHAGSDIGGEPDGFACNVLPPCASQTATCTCLQDANEPCADTCAGDGMTGLTVTCLGG